MSPYVLRNRFLLVHRQEAGKLGGPPEASFLLGFFYLFFFLVIIWLGAGGAVRWGVPGPVKMSPGFAATRGDPLNKSLLTSFRCPGIFCHNTINPTFRFMHHPRRHHSDQDEFTINIRNFPRGGDGGGQGKKSPKNIILWQEKKSVFEQACVSGPPSSPSLGEV